MKIPYSHIKAALAVIPKHDIREYLMGACLDVREHDITLVATDGRVLIAIPCPLDDDDVRPPIGAWCIPAGLLQAVKPESKKEDGIDVVIAQNDAHWQVSMLGKATVSGKLYDAVYPDWRKVLPRESSGEAAQYEPLYLAKIYAAFAALGASSGESAPVIYHNGDAAALVTCACTPALGVIMPRRRAAGDFPALPAWAE